MTQSHGLQRCLLFRFTRKKNLVSLTLSLGYLNASCSTLGGRCATQPSRAGQGCIGLTGAKGAALFSHIFVSVKDFDRALKFYTEVMLPNCAALRWLFRRIAWFKAAIPCQLLWRLLPRPRGEQGMCWQSRRAVVNTGVTQGSDDSVRSMTPGPPSLIR